jgi:hypothetical protein
VFLSITPKEILNVCFIKYELCSELFVDTNFYYPFDSQCQVMRPPLWSSG